MLQDGELHGFKQKATRGYVWRVVLDSDQEGEAGTQARRDGAEAGTSPATPDLMKALEIIETIRREHEEARRDLEQRTEQLRREKNAQLERLRQEAFEKAEKIAELTGAAAHWQTRAIVAEEQVKLLMALKDDPEPEPPAAPEQKRSWWQRCLGG